MSPFSQGWEKGLGDEGLQEFEQILKFSFFR